MIGLTIFTHFTSGNPFYDTELALQAAATIVIILGFIWMGRVNLGTAIGLHRDRITLRDHTGREATHSIADVIYDGTAIATPDMAVAFGNEKMPIYNRDQIASLLLPRLKQSQEVNTLKMQSALIRMQHPQGIATLLGIGFIVITLAYMLITEYAG